MRPYATPHLEQDLLNEATGKDGLRLQTHAGLGASKDQQIFYQVIEPLCFIRYVAQCAPDQKLPTISVDDEVRERDVAG